MTLGEMVPSAAPRPNSVTPRPERRLLGKTLGQLVVLALAWSLNSNVKAAEGTAEAMVLAGGDVIKVAVYNRPDLTGTFPVGADGNIRLPLVGKLLVAGKSMEAVEKELTLRVSRLLEYEAAVIVDMARYRPIFVVGNVANPGEHEYTPDLRVLQAVARAGGIAIMSATRTDTHAMLRVRKNLMAALLEVQMLTVRQEALAQSLDGSEELTLPDHLKSASNALALASLLREQQALLDVSRKRLRDNRDFTERQKRQIDSEISALLAQQKALAVQVRVVARELGVTQSLRDKGLATSMRMLSQQQMEANLRIDLHRVAAYLSRAQQMKIRLERHLHEENTGWREERLREVARISADLARAHTVLETTKQEALAFGTTVVNDTMEPPTLKDAQFTIRRPGKNGFMDIDAGPAALLRAGDVLQVDVIGVSGGMAYEGENTNSSKSSYSR